MNDTTDKLRREEAITEIVCSYAESFGNKVRQSKIFRTALIWITSVVFCLLVLCFISYTVVVMFSTDVTMTQFGTFTSAAVSIMVAIVGLLHIITKYFFPEDDEKYVTDIVKTIQDGSLQEKQMLLDAQEPQLSNIVNDKTDGLTPFVC